MWRIMLLMAMLAPISPLNNSTVDPGKKDLPRSVSTIAPVVFRAIPRQTTKPRRTSQGKNSPMLNYIFDSYAASHRHFHDKFKPPSFEGDVFDDSTIEADTGSTVNFNCRVSSLRDKMVSWLRVADSENLELLTLDLETHTTDSRYKVNLAAENWQLSLSNAKASDSGVYCCHVSTHPPMLKRFELTVYPPEIRLTKEAFLETSETLSLRCMILHLHPGEGPILRWYRENGSVTLDESRGSVLIETDLTNLTSYLQVADLRMEDAGNYTCSLEAPIRMRAIARVHVLQGSSLAELQSGVKTTTSYLSLLTAALLITFGIKNSRRLY